MSIGTQQLAPRTVDIQGQTAGWARQHGQLGMACAVVDHTGVFSRLAVDGQIKAAHLHGQPINPHKGCASNFGLQSSPAASQLPSGHLGRCQRLAQHGQAQINICQVQANGVGLPPVDTGKSVQATGADQQHVHRHRRVRFVHSGRGRDVSQRHLPCLLLDAKSTRHLHKAEHIQVQIARSSGQHAFSCVQTQGQTARVGQRARADLQTLRLVVHQAAICCCPVDLHIECVRAHRQTAHTHKGSARCTGLQTGPAARHRAHRLQTVELFACNRQTKLHARQTQPRGRVLEASVRIEAPVDARKCTQITATDGQHVHRYLAGRFRERAVFGHLRIAQGQGFGGFRQAELALCGHESVNVQRHIAAGLQQLALDTV